MEVLVVRVPNLEISTLQGNVSQIQPETNLAQVAGQALEGIGQIQVEKEKRDARAWSIKADTDLRFAGLNALEEAKNEAKDPNEIGQLFFNKLEDQRRIIGESAPNDFARDEYNNIYEGVRRGLGQQAIQTELAENQALRLNQVEESINKGINFVRNGGSYSDTQTIMQNYFNQADGVLSPVELDNLRRKSNAELKSSLLDYNFEQGNLKDVQRLINDDKFNKDLTPKQIGAYRDAIKRQKEENSQKEIFGNYLENGLGYIDPKDKQSQKTADLLFKQNMAQGLINGDPQAYSDSVNLVTKTGIMPETMSGYVRAAYIGQDSANKAIAYQLVSDIQKINPQALQFSGLTDKQITEATMYDSLKKDGLPEADVVAIVRAKIYPENKAVIDQRKVELQKGGEGYIDPKTIDIADDIFDTFFTWEPDIIDVSEKATAYKAKYNSLYNDYYLITGDKEIAQKRASEVFKVNHGTSRITSDDEYITDYPPENFYKHPYYIDPYSGDDNYLWIRGQLVDDVKQFMNKEIPLDDIRIVADSITERDVKSGNLPSYQVFIQTEDEGLQYMNRIKFDIEKAYEDRKKYFTEERLKAKKRKDIELESFEIQQKILEQRFP